MQAIHAYEKCKLGQLHICICDNVILNMKTVVFTPQPLRAVGVLFSPMVSGWVGGWQEIVCVGSLYLVGTLVEGFRCATSWCDTD